MPRTMKLAEWRQSARSEKVAKSRILLKTSEGGARNRLICITALSQLTPEANSFRIFRLPGAGVCDSMHRKQSFADRGRSLGFPRSRA